MSKIQTQNDSPITKMVENSITRDKMIEAEFYKIDPLHSNYRCFPCQKGKQTKQIQKKNKKKLGFTKIDQIVIKPWHPFLRVLQGYFNGDLELQNDDRIFVDMLNLINSLRDSIYKNNRNWECVAKDQTYQQMANDQIYQNLSVLHLQQIDKLQKHFDSDNDYNRYCRELENAKLVSYKQRLDENDRTLNMIRQKGDFKSQLQQIIDQKKQIDVLHADKLKYFEQLKILERDNSELLEQNYFLYTMVKHDRHQLYINILKEYENKDLIQETDVSFFEVYISKLEGDLCRLKIENTQQQIELEKLKRGEVLTYEEQMKENQTQAQSKISELYQEIQISSREMQKIQEEKKNLEINIQTQNALIEQVQIEKNHLKQQLDGNQAIVQQLKNEISELEIQLKYFKMNEFMMKQQLESSKKDGHRNSLKSPQITDDEEEEEEQNSENEEVCQFPMLKVRCEEGVKEAQKLQRTLFKRVKDRDDNMMQMCLMQAIAIEEMITAAEKADSVENFDVIMEEQNEDEDENSNE